MTPYSVKKMKQPEHYVFNLLVVQSMKNSQILIIEDLQFYLDPMVVRIEEQTISALSLMAQDFLKSLKINEDRLQGLFVNKEEMDYSSLLQERKLPGWQVYKQQVLSGEGSLLYIDNIKISNIELYLSFKKTVSARKTSLVDLGIIMESLGGSFMNLDNAIV